MVCGKKMKTENFGEIDRISRLSDSILEHILSFLPTKQVVQTSVLSKRWKYMWTLVSSMDFDDHKDFGKLDEIISYESEEDCESEDFDDEFEEDRLSEDEIERRFMNHVDGVLILSKAEFIDKFCLRCSGGYDPIRIRNWINAVVSRNVRELDLSIFLKWPSDDYMIKDYVEPGTLPKGLFSCGAIRVLKLNFTNNFHEFDLSKAISTVRSSIVPSTVDLCCLKVLHIGSLQFLDNSSLTRLLSGCPVLEELVIDIRHFYDRKTLSVHSSTVKSLRITVPTSDPKMGEYNVAVDAPTLEFLDVSDMQSKSYSVKHSSSLTKARIDVELSSDDTFKLLNQVSNVTFLSLCAHTMKSITSASDLLLPKFHCLSHLDLDIGTDGLNVLPDLLECSPNLKAIVLDKVAQYSNGSETGLWYPPPSTPKCLLSTLEKVEIKGFEACPGDIEMVKYLLIHGLVLKMMSIRSYNCERLEKALLEVPKGSRKCQITFV